MNTPTLRIRQIDTRQQNVQQALDELRQRLSPRGNVVSAAGRQRTIDVFGAPLSPQQVVERICDEVQNEGLAAVLRYCEKLDQAQLTAELDPRQRRRTGGRAPARPTRNSWQRSDGFATTS